MIGLFIILALVLILPFTVKQVEHNLEAFIFVMGVAASLVSGVMDGILIEKALVDPVSITIAVLVAGLLSKWLQRQIEKTIIATSNALSMKVFLALTIIILGLASSIITAIIAAIILVIIINVLTLDRQSEIRFTVLASFSIGMGAALTPIGEPLSTLTISKLDEGFFYLLKLIGPEVIPAIIIFGLLSMVLVKPQKNASGLSAQGEVETYKEIIIRAVKIYLFVMGLTLLGAGFEPFITEYLLGLSPMLLYWINMVSAVLDNATLAAAEVSPAMDESMIQAILLGLLISGGMLIPGNIPNIIAAGKLNISSKEWARFGMPVGLIALAVYFIILFLL